jgi:periplasmic copper chaperone A
MLHIRSRLFAALTTAGVVSTALTRVGVLFAALTRVSGSFAALTRASGLFAALTRASVLFAALTGAGVAFAASLHATPPSGFVLVADDGVTVHEAWARASAGAATTGAAYVTLMGGAQADSLVSVSTPVAATAEVHETTNDHGVMKMRPVPGVPIPPGGSVVLAPGGTHIMLMGLKQKLTAGQNFPLTLTFAHAAPVTVDVKVRGIGAAAGDSMGTHENMH